MRPFIFTTALPPLQMAWTLFILRRLPAMGQRRLHLQQLSASLRDALRQRGMECPSESHIIPLMIGPSSEAILRADALQRHGFYLLPVRPPTVPEGTSRIRISLTAALTQEELQQLIKAIDE